MPRWRVAPLVFWAPLVFRAPEGPAAVCAGGRRPAREPSAPRASLGASPRSPARPRHRPPAPRQIPPAPSTPVGPGVLVCGWRVGSLSGRAPPPPTGTAADPSGALHTSGAWSLMLLGALACCLARPCRRPPAPRPVPSGTPLPSTPTELGVQVRSVGKLRPRRWSLRPERSGLKPCDLALHSGMVSAKIVVSTPTWRVIRPPVR